MTPTEGSSSWAKLDSERSRTRPVLGSWRSSTVQVVVRPLARSVTVTLVPKGRLGLAQVPAGAWYHEACPVSWLPEVVVVLGGAVVVVVRGGDVVVGVAAARAAAVGCGSVVVVVLVVVVTGVR